MTEYAVTFHAALMLQSGKYLKSGLAGTPEILKVFTHCKLPFSEEVSSF